jgi:hypothetical protein
MNSFTTHIPHGNKLLDVHFSKVACPSGKYFVQVSSGESVVASFEMQKDHYNKWKVTQPVPEWLVNMESHLAQVIAGNQFAASAEY